MNKISTHKIFKVFDTVPPCSDSVQLPSKQYQAAYTFIQGISIMQQYQVVSARYTSTQHNGFSVKNSAICLMYSRAAMQYIKPMQNTALDSIDDLNALFDIDKVIDILQLMIQVFVKYEYYEYCNILSKYLNYFNQKSCIR